MRKDPTEFRQRFAAWKDGNKPYENGLPTYSGGRSAWDDSTDFITQYEGWRDTTYQNKGDVPTIGYGTTNKKWVSKGRITRELGRLAMMEDLMTNEPLLRKNIKNYDKLPDSAKIVLRDILYNVGQGNMFLRSPKFMLAINAGNWLEAANQMDWDNNKPGMAGAIKRNNARRALFLQDLANNPVKPVSPLVESLDLQPLFTPRQITVPVDRTDFSLLNASMQSKAPRALNAWVGANSPAYGGASLRMPSLLEYMLTGSIMPHFKDGKLPGYNKGKVVKNNYTNAKFNNDGTFTDDTTRVFDDLVITPKGVTTKYGSYTDKNWDRYKQQEEYFRTHDLSTGKVKVEPGLGVVSPEFDAIVFGRQLLQNIPKLIKPKTKSYIQYTDKDWDKFYFDAIKSSDLERAQRLRDMHFMQKANNTKVSKSGNPIKTYHTINEGYPADFTEFNPNIEGTHSAIYTSDSPIMSGTYTNRIISEPERNYYIDAGIENMKLSLKLNTVSGRYKKELEEALKNIEDARHYVINRIPQLKQPVMSERQKLLYIRLDNPLVVEGNGRHWNNIPIDDLPEDVYKKLRSSLMNGYTTRDIEAAQMATGNYDGAIINNITDYGSSWKSPMGGMNASNVYQVNSPNNLKLADAITYDDAGKIIPLSKRDNFNIADFRYALAPAIGMGAFYKYAE